MKFLDEYRDGDLAQKLARGNPPRDDEAVDHHGSLRRPDARDCEIRH